MEGKSDEYKKGLWTVEEDKILKDYIRVHGTGKWNRVAKVTDLKRCGKSCRLRWINYLSPSVKRGNFSEEEDDLIIRLHNLLGNRWSLIAGRVPGRTDNQVKNHWNTHLSKKLGVTVNKGKTKASSTQFKSKQTRETCSTPSSSTSSLPSGCNNNNDRDHAEEEKVIGEEGFESTAVGYHFSNIQELDHVNDGYGDQTTFLFSYHDLNLNSSDLMEFVDGSFLDFAWH